MKKRNDLLLYVHSNSTARVHYSLVQVEELKRRLVELRTKKNELFQRIDALEAQLAALKKSSVNR